MAFVDRVEDVLEVGLSGPMAIGDNLRLSAMVVNAVLILFGVAVTISYLFFGFQLDNKWTQAAVFILMPFLLLMGAALRMRHTACNTYMLKMELKDFFFVAFMAMTIVAIPALRDSFSLELMSFSMNVVGYFS